MKRGAEKMFFCGGGADVFFCGGGRAGTVAAAGGLRHQFFLGDLF